MNIKKINDVNFKSGLPRGYSQYVKKNINPSEVESLCSQIGMQVNIGNCPAVAASLLNTIKIISSYSLSLPGKFAFAPLNTNIGGQYSPSEDKVTINSNMPEFYDLDLQNSMEENQGLNSPKTKHFLHTYLHEFIHCAHFHNIFKTSNNIDNCIEKWIFLTQTKTDELILAPVNAIVKNLTGNKFNDTINKLFPPKDGLYAKTNLAEYIAEKSSRVIAENLDENLEFKDECVLNLKQSPKGWNFMNELINIKPNKTHVVERSFSKVSESSNLLQISKKVDSLLSHGLEEMNSTTFQYLNAINELIGIIKQLLYFVDGNIWFGNIEALDDKKYIKEKILKGLDIK